MVDGRWQDVFDVEATTVRRVTDTAVVTGNAVRATFGSDVSPPRPREVAEVLDALSTVAGMLGVATVDPVDGEATDSLEPLDVRVLSVRPGSIEIVLAVVGATSTSLTALVVTLNAIRFRTVDMRTRQAEARKAEAEADRAELEVQEIRLRRQQEIREIARRYSRTDGDDAAVRDGNMRSLAADIEEDLRRAGVAGRFAFSPESSPEAGAGAIAEDRALRTIWRRLIRVEVIRWP